MTPPENENPAASLAWREGECQLTRAFERARIHSVSRGATSKRSARSRIGARARAGRGASSRLGSRPRVVAFGSDPRRAGCAARAGPEAFFASSPAIGIPPRTRRRGEDGRRDARVRERAGRARGVRRVR